MVKKAENKNEIMMELYEKVDMDVLKLLISAEATPEEIRNQLKKYYAKRNGQNNIPVQYLFSKNLKDKGRLYAQNSLSLQMFSKEIRHCLSKGIYYDIDMVNAHPRLILQYCKKNNIEHGILEEYVTRREKILKSIVKFHHIDRDRAKELMLRLCYLGNYIVKGEGIAKLSNFLEYDEDVPKEKHEFVVKFKKQMKYIAESVCKIEKDIFKLVNKDVTKINKESSTLSIIADCLEHKCLMAMCEYFKKHKYIVGVLCFDGLMIEKGKFIKDNNIDEVLKECEKYVKKQTGYEIILDEKPMNTDLSIILPDHSYYVESDRDCADKLLKIEGKGKFKFCEGELYIFNETTGKFDNQRLVQNITLFQYLIKNRDYFNIIISTNQKTGEIKMDNYGDTCKLQHNVIQFIKSMSQDEDWITRTQHTSLGYLLFKDGIYNMKTSKFTKGFNQEIVFHCQVPHNYPVRNIDEEKYALDKSFNVLFDDQDPMILSLSRALAGDNHIKKFYFCPGKSNAGKSKLIKMLEVAFGNYVGTFNAEVLAVSSKGDTKEEAQKNRWALILRWCRILTSNEVDMDKHTSGSQIKKHASGGDKVVARDHYGSEIGFKPHYTLFCMLNDIPKIVPMDQAVINRTLYIEFPYVFVTKEQMKKNNNRKPYYLEMDPELDTIIESEKFIRGFIHIILSGYKQYLKSGMPKYDDKAKKQWTSDARQSDEILDKINKHFEITKNNEDKVSITIMNNFKDNNKIFSTISVKRFNEILESKGVKKGRDTNSRFWMGIKEI